MSEIRDPALRVVYMPKDTNRHGTIFGGDILSTLDLAAAVEARKSGGCHKYVTVAMDKVEFNKPVYVEDVVSFYTRTIKKGRTSITINVKVEANRYESPEKPVKVTEANVTFVAIDEKGRPKPLEGK
jgi:acyl-CoA thioesterase YciA